MMDRFNLMRTLFLLCMLTALHVQAQHPFLATFTAKAASDGVFLEWTINQGSTCLGITIERESESGVYEQVGRIEEVCGSISEPVDYDYLDSNPLLGSINNYRLVLGLDGTSESIAIEYFKVDESGFSVLLTDGGTALSIFSLVQMSNEYTLNVYDVNGQTLMQQSLANTNGTVDISGINTGLLFVAILRQDQIVHVTRLIKSS
jgi:hypothetical protein